MVRDMELTEKQFQGQVVHLAKLSGFDFVYHTWNSQHSPAGFPDLIMIKDGCLIVAELKTEKGKLSAEQYFWLLEFRKVPSAEVFLWRPSDWEELETVIRRTQIKERKIWFKDDSHTS